MNLTGIMIDATAVFGAFQVRGY